MQAQSAIEMINKMKAGIEHQAKTNADTIREQARQDSDRLKTRTVYNAKAKIKEDNIITKKGIRAKKSVQLSVVNGKQRMKLLEIRNAAIDKAIEKAQDKLSEIAKKPEYKDILYNLCLEGLLSLCEPEVQIAVRECDAELVKGDIKKLEEDYNKRTEKEVKVSLSDYVVPNECIGGCVLSAQEGKIQISNTLMDRLHLSCKDLYPKIRNIFLEE